MTYNSISGLFASRLPLSANFDVTGMSLLENFYSLVKSFDELYSYVNSFDLSNKEYVDEQVSIINTTISNLQILVNSNFDDLTISLNNLSNTMDNKLNNLEYLLRQEITAEINNLRIYVNTNINTLLGNINESYENSKDYTDLQLILFKQDLPNFKVLQVFNPITQKNEYIEKVINDLFFYNSNALTAQEFDELEITAIQLDNKLISSLNFDLSSNKILGFINPMRNPYTGSIDEVENVIDVIINPSRDDYTALEFDNKLIDALVFDDLEISAYDFDFINKTIIL
jgi:hypothetical protein